jgi:hypothetical protein
LNTDCFDVITGNWLMPLFDGLILYIVTTLSFIVERETTPGSQVAMASVPSNGMRLSVNYEIASGVEPSHDFD